MADEWEKQAHTWNIQKTALGRLLCSMKLKGSLIAQEKKRLWILGHRLSVVTACNTGEGTCIHLINNNYLITEVVKNIHITNFHM